MTLPTHTRAVVTGAGSGLGRAFCQQLALRGARIIAADIDLAAAEATAAMLPGTEVHAVRCDVTNADAVGELADEADRRFGGSDLVVNNAGVAAGGLVGEVPLETWRWLMDVDLWGVVYGCHHFVPRFRKQGSGAVINVASAAGLLCAPQMGPYNVAKAGVVALSETLASELAGTNVKVTVLCPTFFQTNIAASARGADERMRGFTEKLMARSKVQAPDVARIALDAVSAGRLYALPHADGRWLWRAKRAAPQSYFGVLGQVFRRAPMGR